MASLNEAPSGERVHIGFFGVRNAGKSSVVNAVTGQDLAVVSDTLGTTTDPVRKAMELLPIGPVVIVDTPGIDDEGDLGALRVKRAKQVLWKCDIAVLVVDAIAGMADADRELVAEFERRDVPYLIAWNKADLLTDGQREAKELAHNHVLVSAKTGECIDGLKDKLGAFAAGMEPPKRLVADLLEEGDVVVLVAPIDESAPKGRIILPQQMVLRDVLDVHAAAFVCQPDELAGVLASLKEPPRLVITDSQAFGSVAAIVPADVQLTSFSILMARYKGSLGAFAAGAAALEGLTDASRVLVSEGCTHHRQCEDIGTVKIPRWVERFTGVRPQFDFTSGGDFPDDLGIYDLVIHCGACMLNEREVAHRIAAARAAGVPIVNYGMAIAHMHGVLARSLGPFRGQFG